MKEHGDLDPMGMKWMGKIPDTWDIDAVKRHYGIRLGKMLQNVPATDTDKLVPYIKALQVTWGKVYLDDLPEMWASQVEIRQYEVGEGDLLVCEGGEVGRCGIVQAPPKDCIIQNAVHRVRPQNSADASFLHYVLHAVHSSGWFDVLCNKATIAHFTREKFADLRIPFPSDTIQRSIAAFLDRETERIDSLIAKKQRQIELLNEKRSALISHAVTKGLNPDARMKDSGIDWLGEIPEHWSTAPLYARYSVQLGKMLDSKRIIGSSLAPYLRNVDVQWGKVNTENLPEMDFSEEDRKRLALMAGDLLVCEGGEVGRTAIWSGELIECYYQKAVHRLRPCANRDHPPFFLYTMHAAADAGLFRATGNSNTIDHLTAEKLRAHRFPFPSIEEQKSIAKFLDQQTGKIDVLVTKVRGSIDKLHEYRTALITSAVTGKIDVRQEATYARTAH